MTETRLSCRVVLRPARATRGVWARFACRTGLRPRPSVDARALRRLPRGTWQIRMLGRWQPLAHPRIHRGPFWLYISGELAPLARTGNQPVRIAATVWQHRVSVQDWRRLGVAAGENAR